VNYLKFTIILSIFSFILFLSFIFQPVIADRGSSTAPPWNNHDLLWLTGGEISKLVNNEAKKSVVVSPVFTASAYVEPGFYTYYRGQCDSCLTIKIDTQRSSKFTASPNAVKVFQLLGYDILSDIDVDKNPKILSKYNKVIVLHNEYVTQKEFDAITTHPHVIYLYPNSLYAKIKVNYDKNTITLLRGHNYPELKVRNGFDWKFDNSPLEYDTLCHKWSFKEIKNGIMLNCYPENLISHNTPLLKAINDY